jgi:hypothetical protein
MHRELKLDPTDGRNVNNAQAMTMWGRIYEKGGRRTCEWRFDNTLTIP